MILAIKSFLFHIFCILIFTIIYYFISDTNFEPVKRGDKIGFFDYLALSTSIQAGVGLTTVYPTTNVAKIVLTLQQFLMIATYLVVLHMFFL